MLLTRRSGRGALRWPRLFLTALVAAAATAGVGGRAPVASAQGTPVFGYAATAAAEGVRVIVEARGYVLVDRFVDLGAPAAQAVLDASGSSLGFAAAPDPGELVQVAPGLLGALIPVPIAAPPYPLIARSTYPASPASELSTGPYVLEASSDAERSHARAELGGSAGDTAAAATRAIADVSLDGDLGRVTATASAVTEAVDLLGGLLRLGRVESSATIFQAPGDEAPTTDARFEVTGATLLGLGVSITDDGIVLAGQTTPLGLGDTLGDLLAGNGLDVRVLPAVVTDDRVQSAALEIRQQVELPNAPEPATVSIVLGRATASLSPPQTDPPPDLGGDAGPIDGGAGAPPLAGGSTSSGGRFDGVASTSPGGDGTTPTSTGSTPTATGGGGEVAFEPIADRSLSGFYLVLVLAAAVAVGGGQLLRLLSVRWAWTR